MFDLALVLVLIFSIYLKWFSAGGIPGWDKGFFINLKALTLPAFALALPQASILARIMRSALIETLSQDYFRTARASGLTFFQAVKKHAFRNALIPVLTIIGLQFSFLIAGAIIIENVFFLPGIGRLIFQDKEVINIHNNSMEILNLNAFLTGQLNFLKNLNMYHCIQT